MEDRVQEFFRRVDELAREMKLEVEFTTETSGSGHMTYQSACVEFVALDTHEYHNHAGSKTFGGLIANAR